MVEVRNKSNYFSRLFRGKNTFMSITVVAIVLFVIFSFVVPNFMTYRNLFNLLRRSAVDIILACGMTLILLSAQIDLSVPGVMGLVGMLTALMLKAGVPIYIAIIGGFSIGIFIGFLNGLLSTKIPSFIATLGMWSITGGIALYVTSGVTVHSLPENFLLIGRFSFYNIPIAAFYALIIIIITLVLTIFLPFGRHLYALGGNSNAARSSGIPVNTRIVQTFMIMGAFAAIASLTLVAKVNSAVPYLYESAALNAIAAVVIGGTSLFGGKGHVIGSCAGAFIITMLANVFTLLGLPVALQEVLLGVILIVVILFDYFRTRISLR